MSISRSSIITTIMVGQALLYKILGGGGSGRVRSTLPHIDCVVDGSVAHPNKSANKLRLRASDGREVCNRPDCMMGSVRNANSDFTRTPDSHHSLRALVIAVDCAVHMWPSLQLSTM